MRIKKKPNPQRRCIFCGGLPISKEHVWAKWMRPYLPTGQGMQIIHEGNFIDGSQHLRPGPLNRKGDFRSQTLRVVCRPCNHGWMGSIQERTKPALLPLLTFDSEVIASEEQKIIATWATMFTMVYAVTAPEYTTQNDTERRAFMANKEPPRRWVYWCAPFDGFSSPAIRFGMVSSKNIGPMSGNDSSDDIPGAHVTFCGAGGICFAIFGTNLQDGFQPFLQLVTIAVTQAGFVPLWPGNGTPVRVNSRRISPFCAADLLAIRAAISTTIFQARAREARNDGKS